MDAKGSLPTPDPNALAIRAFAFMFGLPVLLILLGLPLALWKEDWREQRPWQYVIAMAALWIVTALVLAQTRRERLSALREWFGRLRAADVVIALVLTAAGVAAMYFFSSATGLPRQWHLPTAAPVERLLWVPLCLSVGFCEEVIYRGYCLSRLTLALKSVTWAWLTQAVLYGMLHFPFGSTWTGFTTGVGLLMGWLVLWRRSLWPAVIVHAMADLAVLVGGH